MRRFIASWLLYLHPPRQALLDNGSFQPSYSPPPPFPRSSSRRHSTPHSQTEWPNPSGRCDFPQVLTSDRSSTHFSIQLACFPFDTTLPPTATPTSQPPVHGFRDTDPIRPLSASRNERAPTEIVIDVDGRISLSESASQTLLVRRRRGRRLGPAPDPAWRTPRSSSPHC